MFQPTRPVRGVTEQLIGMLNDFYVSTHTPRAGRDK